MNIILGGGIAGLIWAYYNKDYCIVTDQVGGQMMSYFDLGPRYLHVKSKIIPAFLSNLGVPLKKNTIKVGYFDDSGWVENPDLDFRQKYYMKSRGVNTLEGFDPTVLNTNIQKFEVWDVDFKDLIFKIFDKISNRIYMGKLSNIDLKERLISTDTSMVLRYDKLVSTIPLNLFSYLSKINLNLLSYDMSYCLLASDFFDIKEFDYVYDARTSTIFHRLTKCKQGIVCDVLGSKINDFVNSVKVFKEIKTVKNNQIISLENDFELKDHPEIKFLGRYGAWNRRWKTELIIEEAFGTINE